MMQDFDQKHWDDRLMSAKTEEEWELINSQMQNAWIEYDNAVTADYKKNPEHYTTHQDSQGQLYTLNEDGSRKYRVMRTCHECGERNEVEHDAWWEDHMEEHEIRRQFLLSEEPVVKRVKGYSREYWYGARHCKRWKKALAAMGVDNTGELPMSDNEMYECYKRFSKARWGPVLEFCGFGLQSGLYEQIDPNGGTKNE